MQNQTSIKNGKPICTFEIIEKSFMVLTLYYLCIKKLVEHHELTILNHIKHNQI